MGSPGFPGRPAQHPRGPLAAKQSLGPRKQQHGAQGLAGRSEGAQHIRASHWHSHLPHGGLAVPKKPRAGRRSVPTTLILCSRGDGAPVHVCACMHMPSCKCTCRGYLHVGACLCLNYMFACVSMSSHTSAQGRWEGGQGQAEALGEAGLLCNKTGNSTWCYNTRGLPVTFRGELTPRTAPPHAWSHRHSVGWGTGRLRMGPPSGRGLAQGTRPGPDHPCQVASTLTPTRSHSPGQRRAEGPGMGAGCQESVFIREDPHQAPGFCLWRLCGALVLPYLATPPRRQGAQRPPLPG